MQKLAEVAPLDAGTGQIDELTGFKTYELGTLIQVHVQDVACPMHVLDLGGRFLVNEAFYK